MKLQIPDSQSNDLTRSEQEHLDQIKNNLKEAREALNNDNTELAWQLLHSAERTQLKLDPNGAIKFKRNSLYHEANKKLKSWRKNAVLDYLNGNNKEDDNEKESINIDALIEAYRVLHQHFSNVYTKNENILTQLFTLSLTAFFALLGFIAITLLYNVGLTAEFPPESQMSVAVTISVLLFGIMGACLSAIFSLAGGAEGINIPQLQVNFWITLSRPVVGAISALIIYIFIASGFIFPNQYLNTAGILSICFVAGFTERLIIRAVETVTDNSQLNHQSNSQNP